ncbi:tetratricopeptide repeat protein [Fulvivirga sp.]|uniref:tetratricopeptide repeat-containing sensor histidine kinase n=1 Tax=Fulvivirga sp. TaxID=1931237 RepID=UPI0032F02AA0
MRNAINAFVFIFFFTNSYAQNSEDSVMTIAERHTHDSTELKALIWLGENASKNEFRNAYKFFNQALQLSLELQDQNATIEIYNSLARVFLTNGNYDSSLFHLTAALDLAQQSNNFLQKADALQGLGLYFLRRRELDSSQYYFEQALVVAQAINNHSSQAGIYVDLGNVALDRNNKLSALEYFIMAAKLQDSLVHNPVGQSAVLANIGNIQSELGNLEKAITYALEAQKLAHESNYESGSAYASQLLGRIYRKQGKLDESLKSYMIALESYQKMGDKQSEAGTLISIGNIYYDQEDLPKAKRQYLKSLNLGKSIDNGAIISFAYSCLGYAYYEMLQYKTAIDYFDSSRVVALNINDVYSVLDAYNMMSSIYSDTKDYESSLMNFRRYSFLKDSLMDAENRAASEELEMKYQNDKKLAEIELLRADQALQAAALSRQRVFQIGAGLVISLVIILAIVLINRSRVINRGLRLVEMERVRNEISRDLHDDIGSTLTSINILSELSLNQNATDQTKHLTTINNHSSKMMERMDDIVWSINPLNDSIDQLIIKLRQFASEVLEPKDIGYVFQLSDVEEVAIDPFKRKHIFLIAKEAINNAAKYSNAGHVQINISVLNDRLHMEIVDDGRGFDMAVANDGNGLVNIRERANKINGALKISSAIDQGTSISLEVTLT